MKKLALLTLALGLLSHQALAQDRDTLEELAGIPVMDGLEEQQLERIMFDKPEGRIFHAALEGEVSLESAKAFYIESLAQLGWGLDGDTTAGGQTVVLFSRDEETLTLTFSGDGRLDLAIDIKPRVSTQNQ